MSDKLHKTITENTITIHIWYYFKHKRNEFVSLKRKKTIFFTHFNNYVTLVNNFKQIIMTPEAERFNGWAAMLGFVAAVGAYVSTGQIIPGWF